MTDDFVLKMSALCQSLTRNGKTVRIEIYGDGADGRFEIAKTCDSVVGRPIRDARDPRAAAEAIQQAIAQQFSAAS